MQIFVDADACPVISIVAKVAKEHNVPVKVFDSAQETSHCFQKIPVLQSSIIWQLPSKSKGMGVERPKRTIQTKRRF